MHNITWGYTVDMAMENPYNKIEEKEGKKMHDCKE